MNDIIPSSKDPQRYEQVTNRECLKTAVFTDLGEARLRIAHFIGQIIDTTNACAHPCMCASVP